MADNPRQDLYLEISQNLTDRELTDLCTYVSGAEILSAGFVEKASNAHQICNQLEKEQKLKPGDLTLLAGLLRKIGRNDYAKKAEKIADNERKGVRKYFISIKNQVLSTDWKDLAWCLEFSVQDINNIDGQPGDDKSHCMDVLQQWYTREGNAATIHVLMEALKDAELQHVVVNLKDKYPELDEKPKSAASWRRQPIASTRLSHLQRKRRKFEEMPSPMLMAISETPRTADSHNPLSEEHTQNPILDSLKRELADEDLSMEDRLRICKLKKELEDMKLDTVYKYQEKEVKSLTLASNFLSPQSLEAKYNEIQAKVEEERAIVVRVYKGCLILFLDFETKSNFEHFWASYTSGRLSDTLSQVIITDEMMRVENGGKLVRTLVLEEDYRAWRDFFSKVYELGLAHTISADNLLALPPPARHVDCSSLSGLDLAVVTRENQPSADGTGDISRLNFTVREVQKALKSCKDKAEQQVRQKEVQFETIRGQVGTAREDTEAMVRSLTREITRLRSENEEAQKILMEQKSQIQKFQESSMPREAGIEQLKAENTKLLNQVADIPELREEVRKLRGKDETSQKGLSEQKQEIQQLQGTIKTREARIEELTAAQQQQQTQGYGNLTFKEALQGAQQNGGLPQWQGPGGQQDFINQLIQNTPAKSEYNRLCKDQLGIQYAEEKLGDQHRLQVAVPVAVQVYNSFLQYYRQHNNTLPMTYQTVCADRDQARQEWEQAQHTMSQAMQQTNQALQERDEALRQMAQLTQEKEEALRQNVHLTQERDEALWQIDQLTQENENNQHRIAHLKREKKNDHRRIAQLEQEKEDDQHRIDQFKREKKDDQHRIDQFKREKKDDQHRIDQLKREKSDYQRWIDQCVQEKEDDQQRIDQLKQEKKINHRWIDQLTKENKDNQHQIGQLTRERNEALKHNAQVEEERDQALQQAARAEQKLKRVKRERDRALLRLRAEREIPNLQVEVNQLESIEAQSPAAGPSFKSPSPGFRSPSPGFRSPSPGFKSPSNSQSSGSRHSFFKW